MRVVIGGEERSLGEFSAYKALKALEILSDVEEAWREVLSESAKFRQQYGEENFVELSRVDARRQFRPRVLERTRRVELESGRIEMIDEPVMNETTGEPLLSPDPLGHLTDADWDANDQKLRLREQPSEELLIANMIPVAFRLGRDATLALMALVLATNADLEEWDREGEAVVDEKLKERAAELRHRAALDELVDLATATLQLCRDQVTDPFGRLVEEARAIFRKPEQTTSPATPPPMSIVPAGEDETDDSTDGSPTSSSRSADGSDGPPTSSSTEPGSDSSPTFANA